MPSYLPVNHELLGNKSWVRHNSLDFAKGDTVAPLFINEMTDALQAMPIGFIKQADRFVLVVIMGLRPGENLFISPEGQWASNYMPVIYRSSPFDLRSVEGQEDSFVLCVDESRVVDRDIGEPFFNENGEATEATINIFETIKKFNTQKKTTNTLCELLSKHNLITPWPVIINTGDAPVSITGLYRIDEAALNNLSTEEFSSIRSALPLAYTQLLSIHKINQFSTLIEHRDAAEKNENTETSDTFSFSGLS